MSDTSVQLTIDETGPVEPSGNTARFGGRWRLVGAGLSNVWRYGDFELPAPSGRLLLRGPNGTGKTTALEALWPYLLDLDASKLAAGKARPTSLKLLMSEGATSKRRYGYVWLTMAPPTSDVGYQDVPVSFGVRLQYSESASPAVKVIPFWVPGRPLHDFPLYGEGRSAFELEEFTNLIVEAGGKVFDEGKDDYVEHLAARVWQTSGDELRTLAARLRAVRNPTLLGDVSPQAAAAALRESLPGVSEQVLTATADALAESDATRDAFARDQHAAEILNDFAEVWTGHVVEVVRAAHTVALDAASILSKRDAAFRRLTRTVATADRDAKSAEVRVEHLEREHRRVTDALHAIEVSEAYLAVGRLADLEKTFTAQRSAADAERAVLQHAAGEALTAAARSREELGERQGELDKLLAAAVAHGATAIAAAALLNWTERPRAIFHVGYTDVDPGPALSVTYDAIQLERVEVEWRKLAARQTSAADLAQLALKDYVTVEVSEHHFVEAERGAVQAELERDRGQQRADLAAATARDTATSVQEEIRQWAPSHPYLRGISTKEDSATTSQRTVPDAIDSLAWDLADVAALAAQETVLILETYESWANLAGVNAERRAAAAEQHAQALVADAEELTDEAKRLREQAAQLRSGELRPLPKPGWDVATAGDSVLLGAVLEWSPAFGGDSDRAVLEIALAEAGILGAGLASGSATTSYWRVETDGPAVEDNLTSVLTVDPSHPLAAAARAALSRIRLADTAVGALGDALIIGRDGTFSAGILTGSPSAAILKSTGNVPAARHVGARQRRDAAIIEADRLMGVATGLEEAAAMNRKDALTQGKRAHFVRAEAAAFPSRIPLRSAEASRAAAAALGQELNAVAQSATADAETARRAHATDLIGWTDRTASLGLPTTIDQLTAIIHINQGAARALEGLASDWSQVVRQVTRALSRIPDEALVTAALSRHAADARSSDATAAGTQAILAELHDRVGGADDVLGRHERMMTELHGIRTNLGPAQVAELDAIKEASAQGAILETARTELVNALPAQTSTAHHLSALVSHPSVVQALRVGASLGESELLLDAVERVLARRHPHNRRFLAERYDNARAELAGTWTLARGDSGPGLDELDTFVLTHSEREYTPASAAARATELASRAGKALASAEQTALTDFVIGRLPSAIGAAWTRLQDWKLEVNRKMRSAEASSGVGVQVQVDLSPELSPAARTVYELCCKVSDADRSDGEKIEVGDALQALLAAADGDSMLERLAAAVDIREWVDVHYQVTRPDRTNGSAGKTTSRWNQRTGLSGGERRLVVLAPMLAAAAAAYDKFGPKGLRLVPLDEVPAEVDERGREALARYIAELDLDLVCTSYLWDGAPGAWDGVDAHDLESAEDGTVIAFPMLVRGLLPLPGDTVLDVAP